MWREICTSTVVRKNTYLHTCPENSLYCIHTYTVYPSLYVRPVCMYVFWTYIHTYLLRHKSHYTYWYVYRISISVFVVNTYPRKFTTHIHTCTVNPSLCLYTYIIRKLTIQNIHTYIHTLYTYLCICFTICIHTYIHPYIHTLYTYLCICFPTCIYTYVFTCVYT
jgi:hypothetical protein